MIAVYSRAERSLLFCVPGVPAGASSAPMVLGLGVDHIYDERGSCVEA
jgi:hypothetical protein